MAKTTLVRLPIPALLKLRDQVDQRLHEHRADIEKQLQTMEQAVVESSVRRGRLSSPLKGMKVAPKYRGPGGETWSGRGARPRWLAAVLRGGKNKLDDFLIDKPARKKQKKRKKTAARKRQPKRQRRVARKKQPKRKTRISRRKQQKRKTVQKKQQNRKTIVQSEMVTAAINPAAEASE